jgi:predicted enzyme related to lactoylglutathione lyase
MIEDGATAGSQAGPIRFGTVAPQFIVGDVVSTAEFYRDVLGFEITDYFLDPPVHAVVTRGQAQVLLGKADFAPGRSNRTLKPVGIDAYFRVAGVDRLAEEVLAKGGTVLEGPVTRSYEVRELVVKDVNGFVLAFGEDVP